VSINVKESVDRAGAVIFACRNNIGNQKSLEKGSAHEVSNKKTCPSTIRTGVSNAWASHDNASGNFMSSAHL